MRPREDVASFQSELFTDRGRVVVPSFPDHSVTAKCDHDHQR